MKKVYKAHILFTKEKSKFEAIENGYIAVENGRVTGVSTNLKDLDCDGIDVVDFGNRLLIPAMNDMHVHAPQVHNQGVAMDLELLPWLQNYTFPEEMKYADVQYAERMYRRFIHTQWLFGTMRSVVFGTIHTESTRKLMNLYKEAGMGALVGKVAMNRNCPEGLSEEVEAAVEGNEQLIAEFNNPDALVRPIITPRFVPSCKGEHLLRRCLQPLRAVRTDTNHHGSLRMDIGRGTGADEAQQRDGGPLSYVELQPVVRSRTRTLVPGRGTARRFGKRHQWRSRTEHVAHDSLCYPGEQDALSARPQQQVPDAAGGLLDSYQVGRLVLRQGGQLRTRL